MRSRFLPEAVLFLLLAIVLAAATNALAGSQRKLRWVGSYDLPAERPATGGASQTAGASPSSAAATTATAGTGATKAFPPHPDKAWLEISGDDAAGLHAANTTFLDARRTNVYQQGHIAGARPFSVWESDVDDKVQAFFQEGRDQSQPVVVYCSGGDCEDSHTLAQKLYFVGFDNVLVYKDGFPDWQKRNLPIHTGAAP
ncbi:MAG TPA: rhodanese-like domain-containing protein [Thermoanaerobaculia bacterium]|jgi:rhodanese-related sulfurtransferase